MVGRKLQALRALSYRELRELVPRRSLRLFGVDLYTADSLEETLTAPSGEPYDLEAQVFWDDEPEADIRVIVTCYHADTGRSWSDSFILAPDGSFVDE